MKTIYKNYTIELERDPWALKFGMLYRFYIDERIYSAISIEAAILEINELCK